MDAMREWRELIAIERQWGAAGDLRVDFITLQKCIQVEVWRRRISGKFRDPCWVLRLMNAFIQRFLDVANGGPATLDWSRAFQWADSLKRQLNSGAGVALATLGLVLGGATGIAFSAFNADLVARSVVTILCAWAHIDTDLRQALKEQGCGYPAPVDFQAILPIILRCEQRHVASQMRFVRQVGVYFALPALELDPRLAGPRLRRGVRVPLAQGEEKTDSPTLSALGRRAIARFRSLRTQPLARSSLDPDSAIGIATRLEWDARSVIEDGDAARDDDDGVPRGLSTAKYCHYRRFSRDFDGCKGTSKSLISSVAMTNSLKFWGFVIRRMNCEAYLRLGKP